MSFHISSDICFLYNCIPQPFWYNMYIILVCFISLHSRQIVELFKTSRTSTLTLEGFASPWRSRITSWKIVWEDRTMTGLASLKLHFTNSKTEKNLYFLYHFTPTKIGNKFKFNTINPHKAFTIKLFYAERDKDNTRPDCIETKGIWF